MVGAVGDRLGEPEADPEIAAIVAEMAAAGLPDIATLPLAEARAQVERVNAAWNRPFVPLPQVEDLALPGPRGPLRLRHYRPNGEAILPAIVYLHGGGWTVCSLDSHDRLMRLLAQRTGAAVVGVDYRLAPEHPFPAPLDDAVAAVRWVRAEAAGLGVDPARVAVAGDSAGANLALGALLALRDAGDPPLRGGGLFYGCYDSRRRTASYARFGDGAWQLSEPQMAWFWGNYLGSTPLGHPLAEPIHARLEGLPPLYLNAAGLDPLADDTVALAARLEAAGVPHETHLHPGLIHAFMRLTSRSRAADAAFARAAAALRTMLAV
jgi:acetyl esterase